MKRNFTLLLLSLFATSIVSAQRLFTEDFNYDAGQLNMVSDTVWNTLSGNTNFIQVVSGNLTYPGYVTNPAENSNQIMLDSSSNNKSEDVFAKFAKQDSGTVYCTFLLKVATDGNLISNKSDKGEFFISFLAAKDNANPLAGLAIKRGTAAGTINIGIFPQLTGELMYAPDDYSIDDTLLVTFSYQILEGDNNNVVSLWVKTPTQGEQPDPDANATDADTGDPMKIIKLAIFQRSARTPICNIDAIKVSTTWNDAVLPLRLLSFNVVNSNGYASLTWKTCNEVNVKEFEVQRGTTATSFAPVGHVAAKNSTSCGTTYSYSDTKQLAGVAFYRIRIVDNDGKSSYSGIVRVDGKLPVNISVFPNPVRDNLVLSHPKAVDGATIKVVSLNGATVAAFAVTKDGVQTNVDVSKLAKGNYIVIFQNGSNRQTIQITKQ
jgi:hypothetical protein